jgi:uncharacterized damage-inducible protein DinB
MSVPPSLAVPFPALLRYRDAETARWRAWFAARADAVLDTSLGAGAVGITGGTVRTLLVHLFAFEVRTAQRLLGEPVSAYEALPAHTLAEIFALGERARAGIDRWLAATSEADVAQVLTFPTLTAGVVSASKRTVAVNLVLHGMRHWAQIAAALRAAGHGEQWGHDYLLSAVEE